MNRVFAVVGPPRATATRQMDADPSRRNSRADLGAGRIVADHPGQQACATERCDVQRDVRRAAQRCLRRRGPQHRDRRFGRQPLHLADHIAVEDQVAHHQDPRRMEASDNCRQFGVGRQGRSDHICQGASEAVDHPRWSIRAPPSLGPSPNFEIIRYIAILARCDGIVAACCSPAAHDLMVRVSHCRCLARRRPEAAVVGVGPLAAVLVCGWLPRCPAGTHHARYRASEPTEKSSVRVIGVLRKHGTKLRFRSR